MARTNGGPVQRRGGNGDHWAAGVGQAVPADPAVPQAAERAAAASPYDQPVAVPAGRADQDRARVSPHDQRFGFQVRREPAERRVQGVPHPLPGVVLPLHNQRAGGELPGRELGTGGQPGMDERQGGVVGAGQVRGLTQRGQVARTGADARDDPAGAGHAGLLPPAGPGLADAVSTGPGLIGTAAKPTRVLWTADAAGVVTR
jgi:hypothetical protein